ncbi:hypothetical protein SKAU_G00286630 [Synaphobranchus kaupii]|uniref:Uncharacterized protein n=1 Tax=Synaphobranchus kaupii TaxID=118154 RepID=A0A9Q1EY84_SYNKA|nr:hypothetical protein SKAU_G00286630 [Synaphobranchus kaupii]
MKDRRKRDKEKERLEMGKHEIKVEKQHKRGARRTIGGGGSSSPLAPKTAGPHRGMKRALMGSWLFRLPGIKGPNTQRAGAVYISHFTTHSLRFSGMPATSPAPLFPG